MRPSNGIGKLLLYLLGICGLIVFAFYDLSISRFLYQPQALLARAVHVAGEWPNSIAMIFSGCVLFGGRDRWSLHPARELLGALPVFVGMGILFPHTWYHLLGIWPPLWLSCAVVLLGGAFLLLLFASGDPNVYRRLRGIAMTAVLLSVFAILSVNLLKLIWGRVRFYDMLPDCTAFTPWYLPQGFTGNASFPSGHTANACTSLILWLFAERSTHPVARRVLYLFPVFWITLVAFGRIMYGAHFASDVLVSILLCTSAFGFLRREMMAGHIGG